MEKKMDIKGMACEGCKRAVIKAISKVDGVNDVTVDLPTGTATILTSQPVEDNDLIKAVEAAGYQVTGIQG